MNQSTITGIVAVAEILRKRVKHIYNVPLDQNGFYSRDAVTTLQQEGLAISVEEAVDIGLSIEKIGYIKNIKGKEQFQDSRLFFSFVSPEPEGWTNKIDNISTLLSSRLEPKDHKYHGKTYHKTFLGSEVVDILLRSRLSTSRKDAMLWGRAIASACNLFHHVVNEHILEDKALFYVINRHKRRSSRIFGPFQEDEEQEVEE
jgi:hypothetical protein